MEPEHWAALNREDYGVPYAVANKELFANGQLTVYDSNAISIYSSLFTDVINRSIHEQRPEVMGEMLSMWIKKKKHKGGWRKCSPLG